MNPEYPRRGIKLSNDNFVYYCEEIMNPKEGSYALGYHTGKYKFYRSKNKIDYSKFKNLVLKNYTEQNPRNYIVDATLENLTFNIDDQIETQYFYNSELNLEQRKIYDEIWNLKNTLEFHKTDSIHFKQNLLQTKLPEPPTFP